jgi:hypothetical protein
VLLTALLALTTMTETACSQARNADVLPIMLLTGQSSIYHDWQKSSRVIEAILADSGRFAVDVVTTPAQGESFADFAPDWSAYAAVVLDYDGDEWPVATRTAFERYLSAGGGLVLVHAADNAFPDWPAFQRMAGVGGWRGRTETAGPKLRWRDGAAVLDDGPGVAQHPPQHDFAVVIRAPGHPVMRGLPEIWLQADDELYSQLRGPAEDVTILATARADEPMPGATGEHEPMLMTIDYGRGRVFHTTLGHVSPRDELPVATMSSVGFIVTLQRGTEWAATGEVTQPVPDDFPSADAVSLRELPLELP